MPRTKTASKAKPTKANKLVTRSRRSPIQLLEDLKEKRQALAERSEKKLAQYDLKIEQLETRYQKKIKVDELRAANSPEELERELEQLKEKQRLLRLAIKAK